MSTLGAEQLADTIREQSPAVAVSVTDSFLERHPDWRRRYGPRAVTAGVQDAGYHLSFLAAAVEGGEPAAFGAYAGWAARVLATRGIAATFLAENIAQVRDAIAARLTPEHSTALAPYFEAALSALAAEPDFPASASLSVTADVFLQAIVSGQRHAAVRIAREALRNGVTVPELYADVFQPVLYEVGSRWESNKLTVAQEHMATAITQYVMAQIYEPPEEAGEGKGRIVLTGVEGELHNIGAVMVGDLLELSGWRVRFLGTNLPAASILTAIRDTLPTHVGISATMLFNVAAVRQLIGGIRDEFQDRVRILVGGAAFRTAPGLWRQIAADGYASDLRSAQSVFDAGRG
jgi:methanogenic corrinoid protein MtbC1